ncbi:uncharacterized protein CEXT_351841 [Caerostris extrusa]|uniref:Uncharacterized protein n=1 Tax=Caerostris extrusa TaxID=172846 RepID=A0AAV4RX67_CAEEX|nr:uncharacterized protein CEXT_351841 [Caerostris extrusa]
MDDINTDEVENAVPLAMGSNSPKSRSVSVTSRFYEAESDDQSVKSFIENTSANVKPKNEKSRVKQSKHLPYWAWYLIAKSHVWHSLVSFIFMSICRTHTIGLRRFIKEIEYDASLIQRHLSFSSHIVPLNQDDIWQETTWIAEDEEEEGYVSYRTKTGQAMSVSKKNNLRMRASSPNIRNVDPQGEISVLFSPITNNMDYIDDQSSVSDFEWNYVQEDKSFIPVRKVIKCNKNVPEDSSATPHTMTNRELLHHFWKLNCRLQFSSCALQRWYASFVSLVLLRCSTYLVRWLGHPATISDILQFSLPLIMLVVLSVCLAEVNFESGRVLQSIYPTEERINPIKYMNLNSLQMSVYGFALTHGTIVTVVFAMLVAFVSKIVLTEMMKS